VVVRTAHIGAVVLFMGAVLSGSRSGAGGMALGVTGIYLVVDQMIRDGAAHLRYLVFWAVFAKVGALLFGILNPEWLVHSLWFCLVVGGLISHAPGQVRHFALWGGSGPCAHEQSRIKRESPREASVRFDTVHSSEMCQFPRLSTEESPLGTPERV